MHQAAWLQEEKFAHVVRHAPLVSIDFILFNQAEQVLVGLRSNEPAKGRYFVPGGAIRKDESLDNAFARILKAELGWEGNRKDADFLGVFEHFYETNRFGDPAYGTHYVVLGYRIQCATPPTIAADQQHAHFAWMSVDELLASATVHENTKAYFR